MVHNIQKRVRLSLVSLAWNVTHLMKPFIERLTSSRYFFLSSRGTCVIYADHMWIRFNEKERVWSASPLTWFLSLVDVFSCLKNLRKIKSLTLSLVDSFFFKNAMLVDDKFKKGEVR